MIIGVNLPNYSSLGYRNSIVDIAQTAEALGYASLWTNDHVLLPTSLPEPFGHVLESLTTLSYLAATTHHIQLGTGILVLPQRDPLLVAKQAATISHLSGGRLALAVGVGYIKEEYAYLRADFGNRGRLADEYIAAMRELFESDTPEFHGPHINYADVCSSLRNRHLASPYSSEAIVRPRCGAPRASQTAGTASGDRQIRCANPSPRSTHSAGRRSSR